jgi:hypothetical protein
MKGFLTAVLAALALWAVVSTEAIARRGGGSWLDSPGYQRALHESRRTPSQQQLDQLERERRALKKKRPAR